MKKKMSKETEDNHEEEMVEDEDEYEDVVDHLSPHDEDDDDATEDDEEEVMEEITQEEEESQPPPSHDSEANKSSSVKSEEEEEEDQDQVILSVEHEDDFDEEEIEIKDQLDNSEPSTAPSTAKNSNNKKSSTSKDNKKPSKDSSEAKGKTSSSASTSAAKGKSTSTSTSATSKRKSDEKSSSSSTSASAKKKKSEDESDYDSEYFKRMANRTRDGFHNSTDRELFLENLWTHMKGKEVELSNHKFSSTCLTWLIEETEQMSVLRQISESLSADKLSIDFLTTEPACPVLETLVQRMLGVLKKEKNFETDNAKWIIKYIDSVGKAVVDQIAVLLEDSKGNQIVISTTQMLAGVRLGRHWSRQSMKFGPLDISEEVERHVILKGDLPPTFVHHLKKLTKVLVLDATPENVKDILLGRSTSVAQYILFILKVRLPELCQMVVKKIAEVCFANDDNMKEICKSSNSAYIIEILLLVASESRLSKIWTKNLKGKLKVLWEHDIANFIVQRLVAAIKDENLFADVCAELFPDLTQIFKINRPGIGVALSRACVGFKKQQASFVQALMKAFDCLEKDRQIDLVPQMLLLELRRYPNSRLNVWLHGSLILQNVLAFQDPYKISKSLLTLATGDIMRICKDKSGSHLIDAFLKGAHVPGKHKSELVEKFLGHYHQLSCDRFGSRVVENILALADNEVKETIMNELSQHEASLRNNRSGWFVAKNAGLFHFKNRPKEWEDTERAKLKRRRAFDSLPMGSGGDRRGVASSPVTNGGRNTRPSFGGGDRRANGSNDFHHRRGGFRPAFRGKRF